MFDSWMGLKDKRRRNSEVFYIEIGWYMILKSKGYMVHGMKALKEFEFLGVDTLVETLNGKMKIEKQMLK